MTDIRDFRLDLAELSFYGQNLSRPESVLAEPDGTLWTSDNRGGVTRIDPDGRQQTVGRIEGEPNGLAMDPEGRIYIADIATGHIYRLYRDGHHQVVLDGVGEQRPLGAANFVFIDSQDRLWISVSTREIPWFVAAAHPRPDGYIVLVDEKGPRIVADGLYFPNEIRMDAAERYLYVAETMKRRMLRYPVHPDGSLGPQEVFGPEDLGFGAYVDGFAFDAEGNLWLTLILRNALGILTPDGSYHTVFEDVNQPALENAQAKLDSGQLTPEEMFACVGPTLQFPASVTFGGPDLQTVYLGSLAMPHLVTFRSPVPGLPMRHWRR